MDSSHGERGLEFLLVGHAARLYQTRIFAVMHFAGTLTGSGGSSGIAFC